MVEKRKIINFIAKKIITEPVKIEFKTTEGKKISFIAKKKITKPVKVEFKAKK